MRYGVTLGCIVIALSILIFEITPTNGIWKIVTTEQRQQQESGTGAGNNLLIKHNLGSSDVNGVSSLHAKQEDEHVVSFLNSINNRDSKVNGIMFSYPKEEDEHVISAVSNIDYSALARMNSDEPIKNKETLIHQSFRIDENAFKQLKKEAAKRGVSVSNIVNTILKNHVAYGMYFEQLGFIPVSKDFIRTIFSKMEKGPDIEEYSRDLGNILVNEYASNFFPKLNSETLIQFLDLWFRRFQNCHHRIDIVEDNNKNTHRHTFSINHDINTNFSVVLRRILSGLIEPITKSIVIFSEVTPGTITFSFEI